MVTKTQLAVKAFQEGKVKKALAIAKSFRAGLTKEEHKQIVCAYECLIHPEFYKQIGKDPATEIAAGIEIFQNKIEKPYMEKMGVTC
jgi:hypothetical protein